MIWDKICRDRNEIVADLAAKIAYATARTSPRHPEYDSRWVGVTMRLLSWRDRLGANG